MGAFRGPFVAKSLTEDAAWALCSLLRAGVSQEDGHDDRTALRKIGILWEPSAHYRWMQLETRPRTCAQCKQEAVRGSPGHRIAGESDKWYCYCCWRKWEHKIEFKPDTEGTLAVRQAPKSEFCWAEPLSTCASCNEFLTLGTKVPRDESLHGAESGSGSGGGGGVSEGSAQVITRKSFGKDEEVLDDKDWLCPQCWLKNGNLEDHILGLVKVSGGFDILQQVFSLRAAAHAAAQGDPTPMAKTAGPPEQIVDLPWKHGKILVIWDALDLKCASLARTLRQEFAAFFHFVELHDKEGVDGRLADLIPEVAPQKVARAGGLSAVLPDGIFITGCEVTTKVLFYELRYMLTTVPPQIDEVDRLDREFFIPLQAIRTAHRQGKRDAGSILPIEERWWVSDSALEIISRSLAENKFCILDGLLEESERQALLDDARNLYNRRQMNMGIVEQRQGDRSYFGSESVNEGDFLNITHEPRKWTVQGDSRIWIKDTDSRAPSSRTLTSALDHLINRLREDIPALCPATTARLKRIGFRENTMVANYQAANRGRYLKHCDTGRRAVLTVVFYLNPDWQIEDGGAIRLYYPGAQSTRAKYDVLPEANRALLFWSNEDVPHEVMATRRDRFAMTVWFLDTRQCIDGSDLSGLMNLLHNADVVMSADEEAALPEFQEMQRAGGSWDSAPPPPNMDDDENQRDLLRKLRIVLARQKHSGDSSLVPLPADGVRICSECGAQAEDGRPGVGDHDDQWFCSSCWEKWEGDVEQDHEGSMQDNFATEDDEVYDIQ